MAALPEPFQENQTYLPASKLQQWSQWIVVITLVYGLLLAVSLIGGGFKTATTDNAGALFSLASNPFAGLVVGILATSLIQSSSTVTAIIVGLVAGGLPVAAAIPMVMGANVGTTITNTIVSLGHVRKADEFKRAFAAATIHDFFNLVSVHYFSPSGNSIRPVGKDRTTVDRSFYGQWIHEPGGRQFYQSQCKTGFQSNSDWNTGNTAAVFSWHRYGNPWNCFDFYCHQFTG